MYLISKIICMHQLSGKYSLEILDASSDFLNKNTVIAMFPYDPDDEEQDFIEFDVEVSAWGLDNNVNNNYIGQFVRQPYWAADHKYNYEMNGGIKGSTFAFTWSPTAIDFESTFKESLDENA
eukprot:Awhi_evm2s7310